MMEESGIDIFEPGCFFGALQVCSALVEDGSRLRRILILEHKA